MTRNVYDGLLWSINGDEMYVHDGLLWSTNGDEMYVQCLESPEVVINFMFIIHLFILFNWILKEMVIYVGI